MTEAQKTALNAYESALGEYWIAFGRFTSGNPQTTAEQDAASVELDLLLEAHEAARAALEATMAPVIRIPYAQITTSNTAAVNTITYVAQ